MTKQERDALRAEYEAATPGKWEEDDAGNIWWEDDDSAFTECAIQNILALLDALEAAYKEIERLKLKCHETFMPEEDYFG